MSGILATSWITKLADPGISGGNAARIRARMAAPTAAIELARKYVGEKTTEAILRLRPMRAEEQLGYKSYEVSRPQKSHPSRSISGTLAERLLFLTHGPKAESPQSAHFGPGLLRTATDVLDEFAIDGPRPVLRSFLSSTDLRTCAVQSA